MRHLLISRYYFSYYLLTSLLDLLEAAAGKTKNGLVLEFWSYVAEQKPQPVRFKMRCSTQPDSAYSVQERFSSDRPWHEMPRIDEALRHQTVKFARTCNRTLQTQPMDVRLHLNSTIHTRKGRTSLSRLKRVYSDNTTQTRERGTPLIGAQRSTLKVRLINSPATTETAEST